MVDRRRVDQCVAVLDPRLLVMPCGRIARHREADSRRDLRIEINVGDGVVEAIPDRDQLILIDAVYHVRRGGIAVPQPLELLRECRTPAELEPGEGHGVVLWRLED